MDEGNTSVTLLFYNVLGNIDGHDLRISSLLRKLSRKSHAYSILIDPSIFP